MFSHLVEQVAKKTSSLPSQDRDFLIFYTSNLFHFKKKYEPFVFTTWNLNLINSQFTRKKMQIHQVLQFFLEEI